jgi:hypothetical protein
MHPLVEQSLDRVAIASGQGGSQSQDLPLPAGLR